MSKTYRPHKGKESLSLDFFAPHHVHIREWPYETDDVREQAYLDSHEDVTSQPPPASQDLQAEQKGPHKRQRVKDEPKDEDLQETEA